MDREGNNEARIYIMPYKIQKQRLRDIQNSMSKKKLHLSTEPVNATHLVTEYETLEQFKEQLKKDRMVFPANACVVKMKWLVGCLKASSIVPVEEDHRVQETVSQPVEKLPTKATELAEWACQRGVQIVNLNKIFSDALEILQEHAELRDSNQDYSRALAFRRASCVLKSFPVIVTDIQQLDGIKDIGGHARTVIADIIDQNYSPEVEDIKNSDWFKKMKLFTGVFGVGPSTAKKWIDKGWTSVDDVIKAGSYGSDWRISWGLAFFSDLNTSVSYSEATAFLSIVTEEAEKILPGVIVSLVGGFRRGKKSGHDVDILLSHPEEGKELGLLVKLLKALEKRQLLLVGRTEKNSYRPEILYQDFKLSMRGQLDHFEKWLGICKFPNPFKNMSDHSNSDCAALNKCPVDLFHNEMEKEKVQSSDHLQEKHTLLGARDSSCTSGFQEHNTNSINASLDNDSFEPLLKKARLEGDLVNQPMKLSKETRDWTARRVDLIISSYSQYYYALVGWTGSKHFNRDARLYAQKILGMKLTSHGLYNSKTQTSMPAKSEEEVFNHLNIPYRQPTERNC